MKAMVEVALALTLTGAVAWGTASTMVYLLGV